MKLLFSIFMFLSSFSLLAEEKVLVDVYINRAGWTKLHGGYMDPQTKLVWSPETGDKSWGEAKTYCNSLELGGVKGWRLPTVTELQRSVCNNVGYDTRIPCAEPRDHEKDLWVLNKAEKKDVTYWAGDLIPGDPYNAYYFKLDVEGQHIITSKNDKADARCVHKSDGYAGAPLTIAEVEEKKTTKTGRHPSFYIQPMIGVGSYLSNNMSIERLFYMSGDMRIGITSESLEHKLFIALDGEVGFDIGNRDYPSVANILIGPEYYFYENMSAFVALGVGILTQDVQTYMSSHSIVTLDTYIGFGWKVGFNWLTFTWGEENNYSIPVSLYYSGTKNSVCPVSHILMVSIGFRFLQMSDDNSKTVK